MAQIICKALTCLMILFCLSTGVHASKIGVNFNTYKNSYWPIPSDWSAGVVPQTNWNNTSGLPSGGGAVGDTSAIDGPMTGVLVDNQGIATSVTIDFTGPDSWRNSSAEGETGDSRLHAAGLDNSGNSGVGPRVTISDLYTQFPDNPAYDVYVYVGAERSSRVGSLEINGGDKKYFSTDGDDFSAHIEATATSAGESTTASYVHYRGITGSTFTVTMDNVSGTGTLLRGIQVVVPESSAVVLLGLGTVLLSLLRSRRRR